MRHFSTVYPVTAALMLVAGTAHSQSNDLTAQGGFGYSVAVNAGEVFVGEPLNRRIPGRVYTFVRDDQSGSWSQDQWIESAEPTVGDRFGAGLAVDGDLLLVAATGVGLDAIHIFRRGAGAEWAAQHSFTTAQCGLDGSWQGAIALSEAGAAAVVETDSSVAVALLEFEARSSDCSATRVIGMNDITMGEAPVGLAWSGSELLVGDPNAYPEAMLLAGHGADPEWIPGPVDTSATQFGAALGVSGGTVLVGAPETGDERGIVHVMSRGEDGELSLIDTLSATTMEDDARIGSAVALNDGLAVVGASADLFGLGTAFIFEQEAEGAGWDLVETLEAPNYHDYESITGSTVECQDGSASGFRCSNVDVVSFLTNDALGLKPRMQTNDVWGWTDPETGIEYAIVCAFASTVFIDLSDAENPVVVGSLPATPGTRPNFWRDAKTYGPYVYVVADNVGDHGIQIFDLRQLRDVDEAPAVFEPTAHYGGFDSAHNIIINESTGFAYVVGINGGGETCGGGSHMLDLSDPLNPEFVGCFGHEGTGRRGGGATHDAQCVTYHGPDDRYTGREICIGSNGNAVSIADFTDKDNVVPISAARYPNVAYTHQGWLTEDHRYFYQNDEGDEIRGLTDGTRTMIWDLAELDDPVLLNMHVSENRATDHNYYIKGHYLYQSNYVSGLRVLDISDVEKPTEVGYFDTVPWGEDRPGFAGSWSNYPFFESGVIVVSSGEEGVFFLKRSEATP